MQADDGFRLDDEESRTNANPTTIVTAKPTGIDQRDSGRAGLWVRCNTVS